MTDNIVLPINFSIFEFSIDWGIVGAFLFIGIYCFSIYQQLRGKLDPNRIFDHIFKSIILMVLIARILAIINNPNLYLNDPGSIFKLDDGKFFYPGMIFGLVLNVFFLSPIIAKKLGYLNLLDIGVKAYAYSVLWLLLGYFLSARIIGITYEGTFTIQYLDGIPRFPYAPIQIIYNLAAILILTIWHRKGVKGGVISAVYIMLFTAVEFILRFFANGFEPVIIGMIDLYQFIYLILLIFSILVFLRINQIQRSDLPEEFDLSEDLSEARTKFDISGFKKDAVSAKERFSLSYASAMNHRKIDSTNRVDRSALRKSSN